MTKQHLTRKDIYLLLVAPTLLIVIAINQFVRSKSQYLSAWKGGGFGMFSTTDYPSSRSVYIFLNTPTERISVRCPRKYFRELVGLQTYPRQAKLNRFADLLASHKWVDYGVVAGYIKKEVEESNKNTSIGEDDVWVNSLKYQDSNSFVETVRFVAVESEKNNSLPKGKNIDLREITVEIWRKKFDRNQVSFEKIMATRLNVNKMEN